MHADLVTAPRDPVRRAVVTLFDAKIAEHQNFAFEIERRVRRSIEQFQDDVHVVVVKKRIYSSTPLSRMSCNVNTPLAPGSFSVRDAWMFVTWRTL